MEESSRCNVGLVLLMLTVCIVMADEFCTPPLLLPMSSSDTICLLFKFVEGL